jgi:predicted  nucleic acid-binding Zn-ribbon protein
MNSEELMTVFRDAGPWAGTAFALLVALRTHLSLNAESMRALQSVVHALQKKLADTESEFTARLSSRDSEIADLRHRSEACEARERQSEERQDRLQLRLIRLEAEAERSDARALRLSGELGEMRDSMLSPDDLTPIPEDET